jgi:UDP-glucose 4-epimerase
MAVLVTGGAGYIGSHMVWELLDSGEDVIVLDRLSTGFEWAVAPEAKLVIGDIADASLVKSLFRDHEIDSVMHFAGSIVVPESVAIPLAYYENNTCKTRALLETIIEANIRHVIFSSTAAVYGNQGEAPIAEYASTNPESPYGRSKLMTEWMLRDASAAHGFTYTTLRYFNVSGSDPRGRTGQSTQGATHLIKVACETATGKRPAMSIFGTDYPTPDGTCIRDYIHVSDLAVAHRLTLERLRRGGSNLTANCGYGRGYSVLEVVDSVKKMAGRSFEVQLCARRPGDASAVVANSDLACRELDWVPKYADLDRIVADALAWENILARGNRQKFGRAEL